MLESSQFQILIAIDKAQNLSRAGESLGITQSAVSQQLKNLESKLGIRLVERQGKKVMLTGSGLKLVKLGKVYLKRIDDLVSEIQQEKNQMRGSVSIGTLNGVGKSWVSHRMIEFSSHFPQLSVKIVMDFPDMLLKSFENREIDYLILPENFKPAHADYKHLHTEKSTLIFPKGGQYQVSADMDLKQLTSLPLIFFEDRDPLFYSWCREKFGTLPRAVQPRLVVNSFGQIMQVVHDGLGIAVVPTHVFKRSYFKNKVNTLGKEFDIQSNEFYFIYHSEDDQTLKTQTLHDFLLKEVEQLDF